MAVGVEVSGWVGERGRKKETSDIISGGGEVGKGKGRRSLAAERQSRIGILRREREAIHTPSRMGTVFGTLGGRVGNTGHGRRGNTGWR